MTTRDAGTMDTDIVSIGGVSIGSTIADRYHVRGLVGHGGMGSVFRAYDKELDEVIALKVIRPEVMGADSMVRFRLEVKLARRIAHPNVARVYDLGEAAGVHYLTMELVDGRSLRMAGPLALPAALRVADAIAQGLAAVHAGGVVHRDLKPDNILVAGDRVAITDFGIAKSREADVLRTSGNVVGTPAYIAPEQLEGGSVDGRADVYAFGVLLYELIARRLPFDGDTPTAIACARLVQPPRPLLEVAPEATSGVASLVMDMLARRREDRPDAHTVASRLAVLRGEGDGEARRQVPASISLASLAVPALEHNVRIDAPDTDEASAALGADLCTALGDALAKERVKLVRDAASADETVEIQVRTAGDRVRARVRGVNRDGATIWADRVEGTRSDPFALEDGVVHAALEAVRVRATGRGGPTGELRVRYDQVHSLMNEGIAKLPQAIAELERMHADAPADVSTQILLSRALVSMALQTGASDETLFARAETLALSALDRDPSNAFGYLAIATIRSVQGDHAASIGAAREALRRAPMIGEAHFAIGRVLCWCGRVAEGLHRLELAIRLDPKLGQAYDEKIRTLALVGDRAGAERDLARLEGLHPQSGLLPRLRLFTWWHDKAVAARAIALMDTAPEGASWKLARPVLEAYVAGDPHSAYDYGKVTLERLTASQVAPRHRTMMFEVAAELMTVMGDMDGAMALVARAAAEASFVDLLWIDRCPALAPLRGHAEMARARAMVADRVARLLG